MPCKADPNVKPEVSAFPDPATSTISYVVRDPASDACAIIDSVMDIDYAAGRIGHESADAIIAYVRERGLHVEWLIETHVHADHLSAAPYIQAAPGGRIGIGRNITVVQETFGKVFNESTEFQRDGSHHLLVRNRPEGEERGQPSFAEIAKAARAAGSEVVHMPPAGPADLAPRAPAMAWALRTASGPVLACCRSGARSSTPRTAATASLPCLRTRPAPEVARDLPLPKVAPCAFP
ncbi:TIGR01244 family protein [Paracoccus halophilus]|uniref:TIGR01244 family protein n=1 Tax=Paracoccus halophilus TaxID=376733 RepID=A0A1I0SVT2_9RHOB|nr:sulfur transferase domain-containing protein [Paracoccus halophilus]SFA43591.1 TIGR01244 family protein [Paracoccus halophilus]